MRLDKGDVFAAARGRWAEIVLALCPGLPAEALTGHHQPCPKCGGHDRFRVFDDFANSGGAICNQCFGDRNSDGFAFVQWWNGWSFAEALKAVAGVLGLVDAAGAVRQEAVQQVRAKTPEPPAAKAPATEADLEAKWRPWKISPERQAALVTEWAATKMPADADAALASGVRVGNWPVRNDRQCVLAFPGYKDGQLAALMLFRQDGREFEPLGKLQARKTHNVGGSTQCWIAIGGWDRLQAASVVWRVEGVPDGLALLPLLPADHAVVTATCGAAWNRRKDRQLDLSVFSDKAVIACGDADQPGKVGAEAFANAVLGSGGSRGVLMLRLPYQVQDEHGKDLRDYLAEEERGLPDLLRLCVDWDRFRQNAAVVFEDAAAQAVICSNLDVSHGQARPKALQEIVAQIREATGDWPRRVGSRLFVHEDGSDHVKNLGSVPELFGWLGWHGRCEFSRADGLVPKTEVFAGLTQRATSYEAVEVKPHYPPIPGHYYCCGDYPDGDGRWLAWLLDRLYPETEEDRYLILLMLATVFWGGSPGSRPAFVVTADGRGAGKTTLAAIAGQLAEGIIDVGAREDAAKIKERLLTPEARDKRIVQIDNIKAHKFSSAEVEALITAPVISGRELYHGESQRPNTVLWMMTMNGVSLSKDVAERSIIIKLKKPPHSGVWKDQTFKAITEHRYEIICDLLAFLRGPSAHLDTFSRWGEWERDVLARLAPDHWAFDVEARVITASVDAVRSLIKERQDACDVDTEEASMIEEHIAAKLYSCRYEVDDENIFIPTRIIADWYNELFRGIPAPRVGRIINQQIEEGLIVRLKQKRRDNARGYLWSGINAKTDSEPRTDIEDRVDQYLKRRYAAFSETNE